LLPKSPPDEPDDTRADDPPKLPNPVSDRDFCGGTAGVALPPNIPPVEPDDTGADDPFGLPNMLGALVWIGSVAFCFGFDVGVVPRLNKPPPLGAGLLEVEAGTCPVIPPLGQRVLDSGNSIGVDWTFAVIGAELAGPGAAGLGAGAGLAAGLEAVGGPEGLGTGLEEGRTVLLLLAYPRNSCVDHTVGDSRLMLPARS
jgi:hypothetical protein